MTARLNPFFIICTFTSFQLVYSTNLSPSIKISCPISVFVYQHLPFDEKRLHPDLNKTSGKRVMCII
ncbi:hypothetical protein BACIH_2466 [Bacillus amyloliquefaciens]|nr:hypothetical protein U471_24870 [Bacillus amyloliquefaciens CC178]QEY94177.1 hypothetical protein BACIH_2466 [Bacillus amyloliquefaciens]